MSFLPLNIRKFGFKNIFLDNEEDKRESYNPNTRNPNLIYSEDLGAVISDLMFIIFFINKEEANIIYRGSGKSRYVHILSYFFPNYKYYLIGDEFDENYINEFSNETKDNVKIVDNILETSFGLEKFYLIDRSLKFDNVDLLYEDFQTLKELLHQINPVESLLRIKFPYPTKYSRQERKYTENLHIDFLKGYISFEPYSKDRSTYVNFIPTMSKEISLELEDIPTELEEGVEDISTEFDINQRYDTTDFQDALYYHNLTRDTIYYQNPIDDYIETNNGYDYSYMSYIIFRYMLLVCDNINLDRLELYKDFILSKIFSVTGHIIF